MSTKSKEYWQFSYTEMGKYDAPAQIEEALSRSGRSTLTYVGHSQGTTQMFYALQAQPAYWNTKINLFVAAAPVTRLDHTTNPLIKFICQFTKPLEDAFNLFHVYRVLGDDVTSFGVHLVCGVLPQFCKILETLAITHNPSYDDTERFQVYMGHFPAAASAQSLIHYGQSCRDHSFTGFIWPTSKENVAHYGPTGHPPIVALNKITTPTAMFVGKVDDLGNLTDARWARDTIKSGDHGSLVHYEEDDAGHATFIVGKDMSYFDRAMTLIEKYNPK